MHSPSAPQLAEILQGLAILPSIERRLTSLEESTLFADRDHQEMRASVDSLYQSLLRVEKSLSKLNSRLDTLQQAADGSSAESDDPGGADQHAS